MLDQQSILVVDDEPGIRDGMAALFARRGYECRTAPSGKAALSIFHEFPSQAVLSDVGMADVDGLEVTRTVLETHPETAVVLMSGRASAEVAIEALRSGASDFLLKPLDFGTAERSVQQAVSKKQVQRKTEQELLRVQGLLHEFANHNQAMRALIAESFAKMQRMRDLETFAHVRRVTAYASRLAERMGLSAAEEEALRLGALLHDIGKVVVPDRILLKPGPLTDEECSAMKNHVEAGYRIVAGIPGLEGAARIVLEHHERYGGSGYPRALRGDQICPGARIFAVADTYDAMTQDRPYRKGQSADVAREELRRCAGTLFDPQVVAAFLEIAEAEWLDAMPPEDAADREPSPAIPAAEKKRS